MKRLRHLLMAAAAAAAALALSAPSSARADTSVDTPIQAGGNFSIPVASMKAVRYKSTVHQKYDFSCGSAAVATLLTHHYGVAVREEDAFMEMFQSGNQQKIKQEGFSLFDIKRFLEKHGFQADGFEAKLDALTQAKIPAIVLINERGYNHFVVVKGLRANRVLIGDPSTGVRSVPREAFERAWTNRIVFVIRNHTDRAAFDRDADWALAPQSPLELAVQRGGLDGLMLPKRGPGDF